MRRVLIATAFMCMAGAGPVVADCIEGPPYAVTSPNEVASGSLFWQDGRYLRYIRADCYIYPNFFDNNKARFKLYYYASSNVEEDAVPATTVDFAAVQVIRRTQDRYMAGDIIKIDRRRTWYRFNPDGIETIPPVPDAPVDITRDQWNALHAATSAMSDTDIAFGRKWHGSPDQADRQISSWNFHRLLRLQPPPVPDGERLIIANLLLRYASDTQSPTEVPFNATIYDGTDLLQINYYFGNDPIVRSVRICREAC